MTRCVLDNSVALTLRLARPLASLDGKLRQAACASGVELLGKAP